MVTIFFWKLHGVSPVREMIDKNGGETPHRSVSLQKSNIIGPLNIPSGYDQQFVMENPPIFKFGKSSISMGHGLTMAMLVITRGYQWEYHAGIV